MEIVIFWIICGGVAALITSSKGGSGWVGFFVGLILGPLGIVAAFFLGSEAGQIEAQVAKGKAKACPQCAEAVLPHALICKHCHYNFSSGE